jgi:hypothetical protein
LTLTGACGGDDDDQGAAVACPTSASTTASEREQLDGKACAKDGEQCLDTAPVCERNISFECKAGKWTALSGLAAPCENGGAGAGGGGSADFTCPTDLTKLQALRGTTCDTDGKKCLDPGPVCAHNYSVECTKGKWEGLAGLAAPCEGGGGAGGMSGAEGGVGGVAGGAGGQGGAG